jgi:phosphatidylglycerophosphatase A
MPGMGEAGNSRSVRGPKQGGLVLWLATGAGIGFVPLAPGTFGSLLGIPLALAIGTLPGAWWQALALVAAAAAGVPICSAAIRRLGGPHDPGCIVLDEIVGMAATLFLFDARRPLVVLAAFLLFRLFDIVKPSPARDVERLPLGWGVMADDLVAAVYANLSLHILLWAAGSYFSGEAAGG